MWDVSELGEGRREERAREIVSREARRPFDLERGPVWRAGLVRLGGEDHVLMLCTHHIASDGWSTGVMVREFTALYEQSIGGRQAELLELEVQYADYAVWQREWLRGDVLEEQLSYWREQLEGAPVLKLPTGRAGLQMTSSREENQPLRLSAELTQQLKQVSRQQGVTMFMTLLAAFQVVLSRYSGQDDVVVGTDVANSNRLETEHLIGFFINQLVLRTDLSADPTFEQLLESVRETTLGAYAHQDVPFEKLVEELAPARELSRTPLFDVKLVLQNLPHKRVELGGLKLEPFPTMIQGTKFTLTLRFWEDNRCLAGSLGYAPNAIYKTDAELLAAELQELLRIITLQCDQPLSSISARLDEFATRYGAARDISLEKAFETSLSQRRQPHYAD